MPWPQSAILASAFAALCGCQVVGPRSVGPSQFARTYVSTDARASPIDRIDFSTNAYFLSSSTEGEVSRSKSDLGGSAELVRSADGIFIRNLPIALPSKRGVQISTGLYSCKFSGVGEIVVVCTEYRTGQQFLSVVDNDRGVVWFEINCRPQSPEKCRFNLQSPMGVLR